MSFFQSDVVRAEMAEIQELQEEVYGNIFKFPSLPKSDQQYHIELLERLLEKQKVMYTRLSLSDDPQAKEMKKQIIDSASMMGLPTGTNINTMFDEMSRGVSFMKQQLDDGQLGV